MLDISPVDVRPNRFPSGCCAGRSVTRASHGFLYSYLIRWCSYELRPVITGAAPSRYRISPGLFIARNDAIHRTVRSNGRGRNRSHVRIRIFFSFLSPPPRNSSKRTVTTFGISRRKLQRAKRKRIESWGISELLKSFRTFLSPSLTLSPLPLLSPLLPRSTLIYERK